ncbi:unnamed protein product [Acanthoscelides obtectus]|uniref:MADF domain-containing protein n=1 Tax=Acanthoscelides obtectus TaxID=200917 RepID=A0A9P0JXB5_ACAOB|nr:unnamed protein product [Acanthoscelides obtectus]CAK1657152.1 hypothetical protein AOBTE_LOCUS20159 [Acanthoscelides obtectus]
MDAWNDISKIMKGDTGEVKKKMESLLTSFRRERQKQDSSFKTGSGTDTIFKSSWFAFKEMLFLMDKFIPKDTKNTEEMIRPRNQYQEEEEEKEVKEDMANNDIAIDEINNDTQVTEVQERITLKRKSNFISPKRVKRVPSVASVNQGATSAISRGQEAYQILQETLASKKTRDGSTIFGEHVAAKHRKYSAHTQSEVEHLIGDILYKADKGLYEPHVSSISSISHKQYYLSQPNQQIYTSITPSTTPNSYNQYASDTQSISTPLPSPSESDGPLNENESFLSATPSNLTLQETDNPKTPIIRFINAFTDSL